MPVLAGLILAVVQVGDRIAVMIALVPLVVVCGVRAYRSVIQRFEPLRSQWFELSLAAAAIVSAGALSAVSHLITAHGGYTQMARAVPHLLPDPHRARAVGPDGSLPRATSS